MLLTGLLLSLPAFSAPSAGIEEWMESVVLVLNGPAFCTGVVIGEDLVATAYHCVSTGLRSEIEFEDGATFMAKTVAAYPKSDLAILQTEGMSGRPALAIRQDNPLRGEEVYALGHPYAPMSERPPLRGTLRWSVSKGIVSVVGERFIQTDAALNPGNSGGPVVDGQGRIVGIASRKLPGDNISFISPSVRLQELCDERKALKLLGGNWFLGGSFNSVLSGTGASSFLVSGQAIVRERLVADLSIGHSLDAAARSEYGETFFTTAGLTLGVRQRFGRGEWSSYIELGGGGYVVGSTGAADLPLFGYSLAPGGYGKVGFGGTALGFTGLSTPSGLLPGLRLDLELPGVVGVF